LVLARCEGRARRTGGIRHFAPAMRADTIGFRVRLCKQFRLLSG
jgi:hypothetical protein